MSDEMLTKKIKLDGLINLAYKTYKNNFLYFLKILAVFFVPVVAIYVFFAISLSNFFQSFFSMTREGLSDADNFGSEIIKILSDNWLAIIVLPVILAIINTLANAACVKAASVKLTNQDLSEKDVLKATLNSAVPVILTSLLVVLVMVVGILVISVFIGIISAITVATGSMALIMIVSFLSMIGMAVFAIGAFFYFIFTNQVCMIEGKFYAAALTRSLSLVRKNFWVIFLLGLIFSFFISFIQGIVMIPSYIIPYIKFIRDLMENGGSLNSAAFEEFSAAISGGMSLTMVFSAVIMYIAMPFLYIALTIKYYNIINLREGSHLLSGLDDALSGSSAAPGEQNPPEDPDLQNLPGDNGE
ncbi:MAG: hypothetical protein JW969_02655 [Spirochaetales bacterium]|nr:hypothetical protein [Spirochaetales bacterium]